MGGVFGDIFWIDGVDNEWFEVVMIGFYVVIDLFVFFGDGLVIVLIIQEFVVQVQGICIVVQVVNVKGLNDGFIFVLSDIDFVLVYLNVVVNVLVLVFVDFLVLG